MKRVVIAAVLAIAGCSKTPSVGDFLKDRELRSEAARSCGGKTSQKCMNVAVALEILSRYNIFGPENTPEIYEHVESVDEIQR